MRSDNKSNKKSVILFAAGIMLFSITTCLAFAGFRLRLNHVFDSLVEENLMAYTESQNREMQAVIEDITALWKRLQQYLKHRMLRWTADG